MRPKNQELRFGLNLDFTWKQDDAMGALTQNMGMGMGNIATEGLRKTTRVRTKLGRNAPCPCGSGKKYKKCCMS